MSRAEFDRIARFEQVMARTRTPDGSIPVGTGDDAAVIRPRADVVACTDALIEGSHFLRDLSSPADVGWKAAAVNISDIAAMGATPKAILIALQRASTWSEADLDELYDGLAECCLTYGVELAGGDTVTSPTFALAVTAIGQADAPVVTRAGARQGDAVLLVGQVGSAAACLDAYHAKRPIPPACQQAHTRPRPLVGPGQLLANLGIHAMIDVSDGLGADAAHIADLSGVTIGLLWEAIADHVDPSVGEAVDGDMDRLATLAMGGGDDYALIATCDADRVDLVLSTLGHAFPDIPASQIGICAGGGEGEPVTLYGWPNDPDHTQVVSDAGWDHG
ncbi:thiamine-phosphate kinase [Stomatohabitans albus]|uniref:thiamine-phosphate kinase n=1 Tax=Stomatohabitans albus TaxID=3110766 RepID=UPI00300CC7CF